MSEREALRNLAAEVGAIVGICEDELRQIAGNTNVSCLMRRLDEAQAALADRPEQPVAEIKGADPISGFMGGVQMLRPASDFPSGTKLYAVQIARPEPAQLDGGYHRGLADGFDEAKRQMAQEPAQPVAQEVQEAIEGCDHLDAYFGRIGSLSIAAVKARQMIVALWNVAPPSHPAPSEAGAERQERD